MHIRAGVLSNISPAVLLRQFTRMSMGTTLERVGLELDVGTLRLLLMRHEYL